jgi:hypothetical protein
MAEAFPISGNIDPTTFPFLLADLHRQGATGSLKVEGPAYPKALYFRGGRILFGSSNDPKDQLGAILIESGKISQEQLEEVNTKVGPGNPLAKVLAESGFVNQRELSESARLKVERILSDVISYTTGSFEFEDGVLPKGAVDLKLSTEKLVLAAVKHLSDRAFVLRHLESLGVVLSPLPDAAEKLTELRVEGGDLSERLDGRRSLKEAAALTRLDEFEAAKVACALLFLGLVKKGAAEAAEAPAAPGDGEEVDLAQTARMALDDEPTVDASAVAEPEQPFFVPEGASVPKATEASSESLEPFEMTMPDTPAPQFGDSETPPLGLTMPSPHAAGLPPLQTEPEPEPTVGFSFGEAASASVTEPGGFAFTEPEDVTLPRLPVDAEKTEAISRVAPLPAAAPPAPTPPPRVPELGSLPPPPLTFEEEAPREVVAPSRPSKEDLAALDALLNPSAPQRSASLPTQRPRAEKWEPQFRSGPVPAGSRPNRRARRSRMLPVAGGLGLLIAAGAAWFFLARPRTGGAPSPAPKPLPQTPSASVSPSPQASPTADVTPIPVASPTVGTSPTPGASPTATSTPTPAPKASPSPQSSGGGGLLAEARQSLEQRNYSAAAQGFASGIRSSPDARWTVQLLVACSDETVDKALAHASSSELVILPVSYKGRSCHRLCFGLYDSEGKADAAVASIPAYFREGGAKPKVAATASLLP